MPALSTSSLAVCSATSPVSSHSRVVVSHRRNSGGLRVQHLRKAHSKGLGQGPQQRNISDSFMILLVQYVNRHAQAESRPDAEADAERRGWEIRLQVAGITGQSQKNSRADQLHVRMHFRTRPSHP